MPIGTHLVLHERPDAEDVMLDGTALGEVVVESARRFGTPLAVPLMDLTLEKEAMLRAMGVEAEELAKFHFESLPEREMGRVELTPRMRATCDAIAHVTQLPELLPMGMAIGPYSLLTKLVRDPITPVYMTGMGMTAEQEPDIALMETLLELGERVILRYVNAQIDAGAKAIVICEPAANLVYFSPLQMEDNPGPFEHFVMEPMQRLAAVLEARDVDLVFHDCGELTDDMVERFGQLGAAMLSFGSSRDMVEDADLVPDDVVLYGNLPSKNFYATELTTDEVEARGRELVERMAKTKHPFILGTECDVLSVPGKEGEITSKVTALMRCGCKVAVDTAPNGPRCEGV